MDSSTEVAQLGSARTSVQVALDRKKTKLIRELGVLYTFLQEDRVQEIIVNPDGKVFVDRAGEARKYECDVSATQTHAFLASVASSLNTTITLERPFIDGRLILDGSRISGEIPPIVSAPSMRIRRHAKYVMPLQEFVANGVMTEEQYALIQESIIEKSNLLIVGSTASGKTFLANSIIREIAELCPKDRLLTIEDTPELNVVSEDHVSWCTTDHVDYLMMLRRALRATPDRIVVGEVRGAEAYQLLKMWNTGHSGGLATIHSDKGALDGLKRIERCCGESSETVGMGTPWIRDLVGDVIHRLINISNEKGVRTVNSIVKVNGLVEGHYQIETIER